MQLLHEKSAPEKPAFQRALLRWYATHRRDLPWRKSRDPYRILVSEFMLQQTRVETVIPYFRRFLELFPSVLDLARAPLQKVLKVWAGLGYYARARNLHAAARMICRHLGAKIPSTKDDLQKLPGLGPYTAGAVTSLAFNQPVAALDGNVKRVFSRLLYGRKIAGGYELEKILEDLIPHGRASDFNQAFMDLGAMICIPQRPHCGQCPVKRFCASRGAVQKKRPKPRKVREEIWALALVEEEGRFLLYRKEGNGLLAGLWQFPTIVLAWEGKDKLIGLERKALRSLLKENFGIQVKIEKGLPPQEYFFTHIHALMKPFLCSLVRKVPGDSPLPALRWIKSSNLSHYPMSTAMRKIAALLKNTP